MGRTPTLGRRVASALPILLTLTIMFSPAVSTAIVSNGPAALRAIPVIAYYAGSLAEPGVDPTQDIQEHLENASKMLTQLSLTFTLVSASPAPSLPPCGGSGTGLDWISSRHPSSAPSTITLYIGHGPAPPSAILGCAIQDGYYSGASYAALYDPPFAGVTLGATPVQRQYHADLLYAHEVGHVIGGLHELAVPPDPDVPVGGTLMSPILQYNMPRLTGQISPDYRSCLVEGNVCRMEWLLRGGPSDTHNALRVIHDA